MCTYRWSRVNLHNEMRSIGVRAPLESRDKKVVQGSVLEPGLAHLLLERRQQRLELLRLEQQRVDATTTTTTTTTSTTVSRLRFKQPGELAGGQQRVDALDHLVVAHLVVLDEQADRRTYS